MKRCYLLSLLLLATGCDLLLESQTIELEIFPVEVRVTAPAGVDVGGIPVTFSHSDRLTTNPQGRLRVNYQGARFGRLHIAVELPGGLQATGPVEQEFVLDHDAEGKPAAVRFIVAATSGAPPTTAPGTQAKYVVVVDSDCEGQDVEVDGDFLGTTDEDGYLEKNFMSSPGGVVRIVAKATGRCAEIACAFVLPEQGAILNVEPSCDAGQAGASPPPPAEPPPLPAADPDDDALAAANMPEGDAPLPDDQLDPAPEAVKPPPPPRKKRRRRRRSRSRRVVRTPPPDVEDDPFFDNDDPDESASAAPSALTRSAPPPSTPVRPPPLVGTDVADLEADAEEDDPLEVEAPPPPEPPRPEPPPSLEPVRQPVIAQRSSASSARDVDDDLPAGDDPIESPPPALPSVSPPPLAGTDDISDERTFNDDTSVAPPPPPQLEPVRPRDGRKATVTCDPAGLDLYVDGKLALRDCRRRSTVYLSPGVRKLTLSGPDCAETRPKFIEVGAKGRIPAIKILGQCRSDCLDGIRQQLARSAKLREGELACLKRATSAQADYIEAKLMLAHVYATQGQSKQAERVLTDALGTRQGRSDPELRVRLAELLGKRKELERASKEAEAAWRYRMKFRGTRAQREQWILNTLKLRAGFFEQLFYAQEEVVYYDKAISTYNDLERTARQSRNSTMAGYARTARERVKVQRRRLDGE